METFRQSRRWTENRKTFYTKSGRVIKDGGGVEVDFKVDAPKASGVGMTYPESVLDEFAAD
jgi:hypothetical protein